MPGQQRHGGQRDRSLFEERQDGRELPRRPRGRDSSVGRVLGQMQHARAVGEQRCAALPQVEPPRVDLAETANQLRRRRALGAGEALDRRQQLAVRQFFEPEAFLRRHVLL